MFFLDTAFSRIEPYNRSIFGSAPDFNKRRALSISLDLTALYKAVYPFLPFLSTSTYLLESIVEFP